MTYVEWNKNVNQKFYNMEESFLDNTVETEYNSGRKSVYLKNTRFLKSLSCNLSLNVQTGEYDLFLEWFTHTLGGLSGNFTCEALGTGYFRFSSTPSFSTGQQFKEASLEIEQVY